MSDAQDNKSELAPRIPYQSKTYAEAEAAERHTEFFEDLVTRRSVRDFSTRDVSVELVRQCIEVAGQAPSGANKQPWTFVLVRSREVKAKIREAAEEEERAFYAGRASEKWLRDLAPIGTDWQKPFLEEAPLLIVVFAQRYGDSLGDRHYYVSESVGIAVGFLLAALHRVGLSALTHTPAPMSFLSKILDRPKNEKPFLLIPVGYAAEDATVPDIPRKNLDDYLIEI